MTTSESSRSDGADLLGSLKLLAGVVLLVALSWEILAGDHVHLSRSYLTVQFFVCVIFLYDFLVRLLQADRKLHFFVRHLFYLLISIPYLTLISWTGVRMTHDWGILVGLVPMLRAFLAMFIIVRWMALRNRMQWLFAAYLFTVVVFTYLSALVFYDYEALVNPKLEGFGNALWWAWMNVTTVGAAIFPVTAVGKVVCVLLPSLGMMFFPIFTTYILQEYAVKSSSTSSTDPAASDSAASGSDPVATGSGSGMSSASVFVPAASTGTDPAATPAGTGSSAATGADSAPTADSASTASAPETQE
ncbi:potassium channel family protein [uncultured Alistipes sp.]|uniref:potassium channel family protein n=1 Tax=uncultured Alistipes sp. TaxID=538949 RepID=UPI0028042F8C|nr:potassium channel family protein [uncultured Alistipes sp.]